MNKNLLKYVCCPSCHRALTHTTNRLVCLRCDISYRVSGNSIINISESYLGEAISVQKWETLYKEELQKKTYLKKYQEYTRLYFQDVYDQLNEVKHVAGSVYLEIGCGDFLLGQAIAKKCKFIIGIDTSRSALRIAEHMLKEKGITNYLLIHGDIGHMPMRNNCIDLIYGGGVIEHFKDSRPCVKELHRVLKRGGVSFNTVPFLNVGSLTYRQIWGNIPNYPVLKEIAEFIHLKLLGAKHMIFGYEMSFTKAALRKLHDSVGFRRVIIDKFRIQSSFDFVPKFIRPFFKYLADNSPLFWPMVKVIGVK